MAYLILVRHGRSEWNSKGLWTGWKDIPLNKEGKREAAKVAQKINGLNINYAYTSLLGRAQETLNIVLRILKQQPTIKKNLALNERNYGVFTGKNKWNVKKELGVQKFRALRRSWDYPIQKGESLKEVYNRVVPYYKKEILPKLKAEKNVLISAHGNSLRALVKYVEHISNKKIANIEIGTGEAWIYEIDSRGKIMSKEIRAKNKKRA